MTSSNGPVTLEVRPRNGQADSVIPLEWCVLNHTIDELQRVGAEDPYLLVAIVHDLEETDRYVFPLMAGKAWVNFRYPNTNTIHAAVVYARHKKRHPSQLVKRGQHGKYALQLVHRQQPEVTAIYNKIFTLQNELETARSVIEFEEAKRLAEQPEIDLTPAEDETPEDALKRELKTEIERLQKELKQVGVVIEEPNEQLIAEQQIIVDKLVSDLERLQSELVEAQADPVEEAEIRLDYVAGFGRIESETQHDVVIPSTMFAKKPWVITKRLGTKYKFWPRPAWNQCQLRKRAWFTGITLPIIKLVQAPVLVVAELANMLVLALLMLAGMRNINFSPLLHPFLYGPWASWAEVKPSWWFFKKNAKRYSGYESRIPPRLIIGIGFTAMISAVIIVAIQLVGTQRVGIAAIGIVTVVGILAALIKLTDLKSKRPKKIKAAKPVVNEEKWQRERESKEAAMRAEIARKLLPVSCGAEPRNEGILSSLPRARKTTYVYHSVKAKVCKPFAGSRP